MKRSICNECRRFSGQINDLDLCPECDKKYLVCSNCMALTEFAWGGQVELTEDGQYLEESIFCEDCASIDQVGAPQHFTH